jgi:TatA/E family protein of Tat protein translocase
MGGTPTLSFLPSIGSGEWLVLLAVVLIVVGPRRLPEVARKIGRTLEGLRRTADDFRRQIERMDENPVTRPPEPYADVTDPPPPYDPHPTLPLAVPPPSDPPSTGEKDA